MKLKVSVQDEKTGPILGLNVNYLSVEVLDLPLDSFREDFSWWCSLSFFGVPEAEGSCSREDEDVADFAFFTLSFPSRSLDGLRSCFEEG